MKEKVTAAVLSQKEIAPDIYDMWIATDLAAWAHPGQFLSVYPRDGSTLLPRPISICEIADDRKALRLVYRVVGKGTKEFSEYRSGDRVHILGPLGNGFPLEPGKGRKVLLMGGGIGIPPILELAKEMQAEKQIILGYRNDNLLLAGSLAEYGEVFLATEDGSIGVRGNVMDVVRQKGLEADMIYACGPMPMLRAVKAYAAGKKIPAYISLEEHMACGVGACLGCVVKTSRVDAHSHVHNARICTEGPVFEAGDVDI